MATEAVLRPDPQLFPLGTVVKVKVAPTLWPAPGSGEPPGTLLSSPAVATNTGYLTVTGLTEGVRYIGYANVGGVDRYLGFTPEIAPPTTGTPGPWEKVSNNAAGITYGEPSFAIWRLESNSTIQRLRSNIKLAAGKTVAAATMIVTGFAKPAAEKTIFVRSVTKASWVECQLTTGGELKSTGGMAEGEEWSLENVLVSM